MKSVCRFFNLAASIIFAVSTLVGCSPATTSNNPQVEAINNIRTILELPDSPLQFNELSNMINSPTGSLKVSVYHDSDGRIYSVEPTTNQVVEIDARALLQTIPANAPALSQEELRAKAKRIISKAVPNFDSLQSTLMYEEGAKIDNYFFNWYGEIQPGAMNRPFAQIAFHKSGLLFAYYNTLSFGK